jgi:hypothetical protein
MIENFELFLINFRKKICTGKIYNNPGGGTSEIVSIADSNEITYKRKNSLISINIYEIYGVYKLFYGKKCSSSDLKKYKPHIFDSNARPAGHSCNCTFLFMVLEELNLVNKIYGEGVKGNPFFVNIIW